MKLAPYGKPLKELLLSGQLPTNSVHLYIGDKSWNSGQLSAINRPTRTLVLPPNHQPTLYEWPVANCEIIMIETSYLPTDYVESIAQELFIYGATKIVLIAMDLLSTVYKKDL